MRAVLLAAGLLLACMPAAALAGPTVLILNSYHPGYPFSDDEQQAIQSTLADSRPDVTTLIEYLDTKHYPHESHYAHLAALLGHKLERHALQLVVALDDPALAFVHAYRQQLFAGVPVVFAGINAYEPALLQGDTMMTGVAEELDVPGTLQLINRLQPEITEVMVVNDASRTGQNIRQRLLALPREKLAGLQVRFASDTSLLQAAQELAAVTKERRAVGLLLSYAADADGIAYNTPEVVQILAMSSHAPLYAVHDNRLGHGVVGGMLFSGTQHGRRAAELALQVLAGVPAGNLPVDTTATTLPMFDDAVLRRWGLDAAKLPAETALINRPQTLWQSYRRVLLTEVAVIAELLDLIGMLLISIARRRRAEQELRSLDQMKSNLLANVSHELRTPLVAIRGYNELIAEGMSGAVTPLQREQLLVVIRNIDRLLGLIDNLLNFAKLEVGTMRLNCAPCELRELVRDAVNTAEPKARRAQVALRTVLPDDAVMLTADADRISQVCNNLIDNAIKFTPPSGTITLTVRRERRQAVLQVQDTGMGIPEEAHTRIFERFYQVDCGPTRRRGGTGIGLAIVREIVRLHHGSIKVSSAPGKGTLFTVVLPYQPQR